MSEDRLFKQADQQEQVYAPQQVPGQPQDRVAADEHANTSRDNTQDHTPVAAPSGNVVAAPASDEFEPGLNREERDLRRGDTSVIGPDLNDEAEVDRRRTR